MVILQFNKLIRNKWVWGVFAATVCAAFCFDDLFRSSRSDRNERNPLEKLTVKYDAALEAQCKDAMRLTTEANRSFKMEDLYADYATAVAFDQAGVRVPDAELGRFISENYLSKFESQGEYQQWLQDSYGMSVSRFEGAWRRSFQKSRGLMLWNAATCWVSPMELDQVKHDYSDDFAVSVADFTEVKSATDKEITAVDDAALEAWYAANATRVQVPVTYSYRYLEFNASNEALAAGCKPTEEEVKAYYEKDPENIYWTTNATGERVAAKEFAAVSTNITTKLTTEKFMVDFDKALRKRCNMANDAFADDTSKDKRAKASLLDALAAEYALAVKTVDSVMPDYNRDLVSGLATPAGNIFFGAPVNRLKNIAPSADGLRYAYLKSAFGARLWVVEAVAEKPAEKATFEVCKEKIRSYALREARQKAYQAAVAEIVKGGVDAVKAKAKVADPVTVNALNAGEKGMPFNEIRQLNKGEMTSLIDNKVYICADRTAGTLEALTTANAAAFSSILSQERPLSDISKWKTWNLKRLGYADKSGASEY